MKLSRFLFFLFIFVVILVSLNILLMIYMTQSRINALNDFKKFNFQYKVNEDSFLSIHDLPEDKSGEYYVHKNFIRAENASSFTEVVLASHCTGDHLHHLVSLSDIWQGPLSIAVFVPGRSLESTLTTLYILYACFTKIRQKTTVHLVHPVNALLNEQDLMFLIRKSGEIKAKCSRALKQIKNANKNLGKNYDKKVEYPNNLLRNIAKHGVEGRYSLVVDIDMIPNQALYTDFMIFATENNLFVDGNSFYSDKSVFVLPAFEVRSKGADYMPKDKRELVNLLDEGKVRPFYYDICRKCQRPTDYERWQSFVNYDKDMDVGYEIEWQDPWEPFFISPKSAPDYDERFRQYGFNRISHACELHIAGYQYFVLDRGFLLHRGFKNKESFHKTKNEENNKNRMLFRTFKTELKDKYPKSLNRC
ncbi:beta-1,4-glucuronyltransferase 1-like [Dendronephthya gigantea]|uniref:beta-1,4-glucuronyltransferase 1-like n=1 Tax=Dendronephthya gigantea TaxID=151771 RepID=UPI00106B8FAE|nr:beta-1,4-glucuronyltransferase 1-like [Dendronephthya gigantea]